MKPDLTPRIRIYGDGRVLIHRRKGLKNAGDSQLYLTNAEFRHLLRQLSRRGVLDLGTRDLLELQANAKKDKLAQTGSIPYWSHTGFLKLEIRLEEYSSGRNRDGPHHLRAMVSAPFLYGEEFPEALEYQTWFEGIGLLLDLTKRKDLIPLAEHAEAEPYILFLPDPDNLILSYTQSGEHPGSLLRVEIYGSGRLIVERPALWGNPGRVEAELPTVELHEILDAFVESGFLEESTESIADLQLEAGEEYFAWTGSEPSTTSLRNTTLDFWFDEYAPTGNREEARPLDKRISVENLENYERFSVQKKLFELYWPTQMLFHLGLKTKPKDPKDLPAQHQGPEEANPLPSIADPR